MRRPKPLQLPKVDKPPSDSAILELVMKKLPKVIGFSSSAITFLTLTANVFAQTATSSAKGGTTSSLPKGGSTELTYLFFLGGLVLFVFGMMKLVSSYREN